MHFFNFDNFFQDLLPIWCQVLWAYLMRTSSTKNRIVRTKRPRQNVHISWIISPICHRAFRKFWATYLSRRSAKSLAQKKLLDREGIGSVIGVWEAAIRTTLWIEVTKVWTLFHQVGIPSELFKLIIISLEAFLLFIKLPV